MRRAFDRFDDITAVTAAMIMTRTPKTIAEDRRFALQTAVSLIQPYAPHIACELWERLGGQRLWDEPWPQADPAMLESDAVTYAVQVNGTTVASWTNASTKGSWLGKSVDLSAYAGQTVTLKFQAVNDSSLPTSFYVDVASVLA